jgi:hypothetical protein
VRQKFLDLPSCIVRYAQAATRYPAPRLLVGTSVLVSPAPRIAQRGAINLAALALQSVAPHSTWNHTLTRSVF